MHNASAILGTMDNNLNNVNTPTDSSAPQPVPDSSTEPVVPKQLAPVPVKLPIKEIEGGTGKAFGIFLLVLLVLAAGAAAVYFLVLNKPA